MSDYKTYSAVNEKLKTATRGTTKTAVCSACLIESECTVFKKQDETLYVCDSCLGIMEMTDKIIGMWYE